MPKSPLMPMFFGTFLAGFLFMMWAACSSRPEPLIWACACFFISALFGTIASIYQDEPDYGEGP